jgi:hypothetical protein
MGCGLLTNGRSSNGDQGDRREAKIPRFFNPSFFRASAYNSRVLQPDATPTSSCSTRAQCLQATAILACLLVAFAQQQRADEQCRGAPSLSLSLSLPLSCQSYAPPSLARRGDTGCAESVRKLCPPSASHTERAVCACPLSWETPPQSQAQLLQALGDWTRIGELDFLSLSVAVVPALSG